MKWMKYIVVRIYFVGFEWYGKNIVILPSGMQPPNLKTLSVLDLFPEYLEPTLDEMD